MKTNLNLKPTPTFNQDSVGVTTINGREGIWNQTYSGKRFYFLNPTIDQICIEDIAHSLSKQCRYNGHVKEFYSVAQHSYLGAGRFLQKCNDPNCVGKARMFLLHDATEAYIGDLIRPLKILLPEFCEIEDKIHEVIAEKFGLPHVFPKEIKEMDNTMLAWEKRDLVPNSEVWPNMPDISGLKLPLLQAVDPTTAERVFLSMYKAIFG